MNAVTDFERFAEKARAALNGMSKSERFDPNDWNSPKHRFGNVLKMIDEGRRAGKTDEETDAEISAKWPGVKGDVLKVYRLIYEGKTCELSCYASAENIKAHRKRVSKASIEAHRRKRDGKSRGV